MSKYYREEDLQRALIGFIRETGIDEKPYDYAVNVLDTIPPIEVSEDCVSRKWLEEYKEVISYKNMWHMTEIDEFVSWENIEDAPSVIPQVSNEDAISREYMLRALNGYGKDWQEDCEIAEIIRNAPSVTPKPKDGEWIPCSERLPSEFSDDERVLVTTDVDEMGVIIMPIYDVKSWYRKGYITAWMPLPKPYKGADNEID